VASTKPRGQKVYSGRTVDAWFDMSYSGIAHYAVTSDELADALQDLAESGKEYAESISPRSTRATGPHYADSWVLKPYIETRVGVPPFPRGAYELANISDHAEVVEFGNGTDADPGYRIFMKTIDFMRGRAT
jgi:hypothetical protein